MQELTYDEQMAVEGGTRLRNFGEVVGYHTHALVSSISSWLDYTKQVRAQSDAPWGGSASARSWAYSQ